MSIIGGLFKVILSPLINWVMTFLYGILIRGPLSLLNSLDHAFQYVSGTEVDKMLFSTSIVDGHPQLNFFASSSPLKFFFLLVLGVAGALLVLFFGLMIVQSITKKGSNPLKKFGKVIISTSVVFAIPLIFLSALSLIGGLLGAVSGNNVVLSKNDILSVRTSVQAHALKIRNTPITAKNSFDDSLPINGMLDISNKDTSMSLSKIYENLSKKAWTNEDESITSAAQASQEDFAAIKRLVVTYSDANKNYQLNNDYESKLDELDSTIGKLAPNMKDEVLSDQVKSVQDYSQSIQDAINQWVEDSNTLMTYEGPDLKDSSGTPIVKNIALHNFRRAYENTFWGRKTDKQLMTIGSVSTLQDFDQELGYFINGSPSNTSGGLITLKERLSSFNENSLVKIFYHVATGNKDNNWDRSMPPLKNGGFMILIGFGLIVGALIIMTMAVLFAVTRIFDLALLFIISPAVVVLAPVDDGARFKTWLNMVIAKLISILGIVISLRLFGTLNVVFDKALDTGNFSGNSGWLVKTIIKGMFGLGGMLAAYKSTQTLSGIVGAGYGIMDGLQATQAMGIVKGISRIARPVASGVGAAVGMRAASGGSGGDKRSRIGTMKSTWKNRASSADSKLTSVTRGRLGSSGAKANRLDRKTNSLYNKRGSKQARGINKELGQKNLRAKTERFSASKGAFKASKGKMKGRK